LTLVIFGYALNPEVQNLRAAIADESRTPQSRELLSALTESGAFRIQGYYQSAHGAEAALRRLEADLAIIVPTDYARSLARRETAQIQVWIDAVNANSGAIASAYLSRALADYNQRLLEGGGVPGPARVEAAGLPRQPNPPDVSTQPIVLYNPGLVYPWFFVTGVMSVVLFLNGALVASALSVREKELGTIEQLLMSPAQTAEMLLAKTAPVLVVLLADLLIALLVSRLVFDLPVRGSLLLLAAAGGLASMAGTGIGIALATYSATQQQAQLLTFFLLPPIVLLSGAFSAIESMPPILQRLSLLDPLRYLLIIVRGITLKGAGLAMLWKPLLTLACFAVALYGISAWRFRKQLG